MCATVSVRRLIPTSTSRPPPSNLRDVVHDTSAAASDAPPFQPSPLAAAAAASAVGEADVAAWGGTVGRRRHPAGSRRYLPSTCAGSGAQAFELSCSREYVGFQRPVSARISISLSNKRAKTLAASAKKATAPKTPPTPFSAATATATSKFQAMAVLTFLDHSMASNLHLTLPSCVCQERPCRVVLAGAEEVVDGGAEPVELVRDGQVPPLQPAGGAVHTDRLVSLRV